MNTRILTFIFFAIFGILISCKDDDTSAPTGKIKGTWYLKNVSGSLLGVNINYKRGDVIWHFEGAKSLVIENNIMNLGSQNIHAGPQSGTYNYEIQVVDGSQTLFINNSKIGVLLIRGNKLQIDDGLAADGYMKEFER
jgi:hypothetical protein